MVEPSQDVCLGDPNLSRAPHALGLSYGAGLVHSVQVVLPLVKKGVDPRGFLLGFPHGLFLQSLLNPPLVASDPLGLGLRDPTPVHRSLVVRIPVLVHLARRPEPLAARDKRGAGMV